MRTMLPQKDGESLWWKVMSRGKRAVTINLSTEAGQNLVKRLAPSANILIENFRPGTLERWGLGPDDLADVCEDLVMLRVSGYGQTGPMRERPGYGTVAEAMTGFAHLNGSPEEPPTFPSVSLADGVAGTFGALGALAAVIHQKNHPNRGVQVVDVALFEALFRLIPVQIPAYDQLGISMKRPGNFLGSHGVLRNLYATSDGIYFCVSAIGHEPIRRILLGVGATDLAAELDDAIAASGSSFESFLERADRRVGEWAAQTSWHDVAEQLEGSGAVFQRIYDAAAIVEDEQYNARDDLVRVPDESLGSVLMPGVVPKFPGLQHQVRHAGSRTGRHTHEVLQELLSLSADEIATLRAQGAI